ncbi:MAG: DUF4340 domain-containing protein [Planctomycetota bacterium]|jgi:hypothetical protein
MSRTNLILLVVLIVVAGVWMLSRDTEEYGTAKQAARFFPEFNKEAADRVVIEGGWLQSRWVLDRLGSGWRLSSAGGYPAKSETLEQIVDAVLNLRRENLVGESDQLREDTRTGDQGRLVRIFKGDKPMAEFRVGKNPKQGWQTYFVRGENESEIYRTRTILTKDRDKEVPSGPMGGGPSGFNWDTYLESIDSWVERKVWDLGDAEAQEIWLTREDLDVKLVRKGEDQWELKEGDKEPVPADADAASAISSSLRYLNLDDVVGRYEEIRGEYGLDKPAITLVLTLKKKIEKKKEEEAKPSEDGEKEEKEDKKEEPKEEFKIIHRTIEVGKKVKLPRRFNEDEGKVEEEEFYPIHVGGDFDDPDEELRADFIFLVDDYVVRNLKKDLEELKQEPPEEEKVEPSDKKEEETGADEPDKEATPPEEEKGDEAAPPEKEEEEPTPPEKEEPAPEKGEGEPAPPEKEEPAPEKEKEPEKEG